jgi:phosphoribosylaminoimidazolecarboxamide formyltransferase/IMP cyclohydrolase
MRVASVSKNNYEVIAALQFVIQHPLCGVLIANTNHWRCNCNRDQIICEVVIAPKYDKEGLQFWGKENRIILIQNEVELPNKQVRTCLNGL